MNRLLYGCSVLAFFTLSADPSSPPPPTGSGPYYPPIVKRNGRAGLPGADLNIDYLYWTARQDSLEFAYSGTGVSANNPATPGKIFHPHYDWTSGYRIGLAAYTAYDGWDLMGQYTWFKSSTQAHVGPLSNLKPVWKVTNFTPTSIQYAANHWNINLNVFDLLVRRRFLLSPKFVIQPGIGIKSVWNKQTYITTYDGIASGRTQSGVMHIRQTTDGLGILAQLATNWYFTKPVSLYGRIAVSTIWQQVSSHRIDTIEDATTLYSSLDTKQSTSFAAPILETFLGFSFESSLYKKKIQAVFMAGYEFQIWYDTNQFVRTILDSNGSLGNLNLQGLTLRGQLEF